MAKAAGIKHKNSKINVMYLGFIASDDKGSTH